MVKFRVYQAAFQSDSVFYITGSTQYQNARLSGFLIKLDSGSTEVYGTETTITGAISLLQEVVPPHTPDLAVDGRVTLQKTISETDIVLTSSMYFDNQIKVILAPLLQNSTVTCYKNEVCTIQFGTYVVTPTTSSLAFELYVDGVLFDPALYPFSL